MPLEIARTADTVRDELVRNLRSPAADDEVRDHIRVVTGPQPYKHNHYTADEFFRFDPAAGAVRNVYGHRLLRVTGSFFRSLHESLGQAAGAAGAGELLYRAGFTWGAADMLAFSSRVQQEYEVEFEKMGMGQMLETWWWPLRAAGWGVWRYDFRHARHGLVLIDLQESAAAAALGRTGQPACHLYAGLFAAVFSHLARRELAGLELQCTAAGADRCRFVVATEKRTRAALPWRDSELSVDEILKRLIATAAA